MNIEKGMPKTQGLAKAAAVLTRSLASQERTKVQPDEIHRMLVLSTAHIKKSTATDLELASTGIDMVMGLPAFFKKGALGWFICVDPIDGETWFPDDLLNIIAYSRARGCTWIMLDLDGPVVDGLKTWEW